MKRERSKRHGMRNTPEYRVWANMKSRCSNTADPGYAGYGARGIAVCAEWADFLAFFRDMGPRPSASHSIDRIDNSRGYEPDNYRWATSGEQQRNTRRTRLLEHGGERLPLIDWAKRAGIHRAAFWYRLKRGMSVAEAITCPPGSPRGRRRESSSDYKTSIK